MKVCHSYDGNHHYVINNGFAICVHCFGSVTVASLTKFWIKLEED